MGKGKRCKGESGEGKGEMGKGNGGKGKGALLLSSDCSAGLLLASGQWPPSWPILLF